jgi:hypothetical protein
MADDARRRPGRRIAPSTSYSAAPKVSADPERIQECVHRGREAEESGREGLALRCYEQGAALYATAATPADVALPEVATCLVRSAGLMDRPGTFQAAGQRYLQAADVFAMLARSLEGRDEGRAAVARAEAERSRAAAEAAQRSAAEVGQRTAALTRADAAQRAAHFDAFARLLGRI